MNRNAPFALEIIKISGSGPRKGVMQLDLTAASLTGLAKLEDVTMLPERNVRQLPSLAEHRPLVGPTV
ncbi:hypothetical protein SIM91_44045 [Rhodococcus opacus]|uniref:hypothetical protein n=1 Tax=Rhodococcus opacus TaxID=37919 RepID=UPI0007CD68CB|nr:hypothetical protein [Rhodococcus opacus]MDX5970118.1 hypothetical protein [Rhodococcus opacus]NKY75210.1 hypothetical protein [Rhodococcus opacus]CAG7633568.1 hypothetical protein E143388_07514 [Rhodococcus opacus]